MADYTPHQQKIIKRYYDNRETIGYQRLSELVSEIYLADGNARKLNTLWKYVAAALEKLPVPAGRRDHLLQSRDPGLLAELVKELSSG